MGLAEVSMPPDGLLSRPAPVPRRFLRYLAGCRRPVVIATALGHVMRGAFLRNGRFVGGGRCKASWVADVFEVDIRNVKTARQTLIRDGWLIGLRSSQCAMNRWGAAFQFDFERRLNPEKCVTKSPPPHVVGGTNSPPPYRNKNLLIGSGRTMKPAQRGPIGSYIQSGKEGQPTLRKVTREDLHVPIRNEGLFRDAVRMGLVLGTPAGRLYVFGAIEHAKAHGTKNACGLFVWIVRNRRWNHINQGDEDRAQATIRALREGDTIPKRDCAAQADRVNGSAPGATRGSAPEAARQILAGTLPQMYPSLAELSAALSKEMVA